MIQLIVKKFEGDGVIIESRTCNLPSSSVIITVVALFPKLMLDLIADTCNVIKNFSSPSALVSEIISMEEHIRAPS